MFEEIAESIMMTWWLSMLFEICFSGGCATCPSFQISVVLLHGSSLWILPHCMGHISQRQTS